MVADLKFQMNSMSPEEVVPLFYPQIYNISDPNLSDAEFPPVSGTRITTVGLTLSVLNVGIVGGSAATDSATRPDLLGLQRAASLFNPGQPGRPLFSALDLQSGRLFSAEHEPHGRRNVCGRGRVTLPHRLVQFN